MQRLHNIDKWIFAEGKVAINFELTDPRKVRLDVNVPGEVGLTYCDSNGLEVFLGLVRGRDVVEFTTTGEFAIIPDGPMWYYTIDGVDASFSIPDAVTLTRIAERRARNLEFEMMQYEMNRNLERRLAEQRDQLEQLLNRSGEVGAPASAQPAPTGDAAGGTGQPAPAAASDGDTGGVSPAT